MQLLLGFTFFFLLLCGAFSQLPDNLEYNITRKTVEGKINVHLTFHSHEDTGWLMTVDEYFDQSVRYVIDTVLASLLFNEKRRFNYVEMGFLSRWWEEQREKKRELFREVVRNGQIEFVNGGWCMHDEATPFFGEMVDQTTRGHIFILKEFGRDAIPNSTWQIDPFGHSGTQSSLLSAQAGMPSVFWWRFDEDIRNSLRTSADMDFIWRGSSSFGDSNDIFVGAFWGRDGNGEYQCPVSFEKYSDFVQDNPSRYTYQLEEYLNKTKELILQQVDEYPYGHNHILWCCGGDFNFKNALVWYHSVDVLAHHLNKDERFNMLYSTPAYYAESVHKTAYPSGSSNGSSGKDFTLIKGDFLPLHETKSVYWNGYYSSRVPFKRFVRHSFALLQSARQIEAFTFFQFNDLQTSPQQPPHRREPVVGHLFTDELEGVLSLSMHHDAITGTALQAVNNDYAQRISEALNYIGTGLSKGINQLLESNEPTSNNQRWSLCVRLNISICELSTSANDSFSVLAWNPLAQQVDDYTLRIPVKLEDGQFWNAVSSDGQILKTQLVPIDQQTLEIPRLYLNAYGIQENQKLIKEKELSNNATHVLLSQVSLPPVGYATVSFAKSTTGKISEPRTFESRKLTYENKFYRVTLAKNTGVLRSITNLKTGFSCDLSINWGYYVGARHRTSFRRMSAVSGPYIFRPENSTFISASDGKPVKTEIVEGPLSIEIHQKFSDLVSHTIRLDNSQEYVEIEYTAGPLGKNRGGGMEFAVRYSSCLSGSRDEFETDSNGLEMMKRVRNKRLHDLSDPSFVKDEPIANNYYPVSSMISLKDTDKGARFSVITDSAQGGASINPGELELMVLRRVFGNDGKGVVEPLDENMCGCGKYYGCNCSPLVVRGIHRLVFERIDTPTASGALERRSVMYMQQYRPTLLFSLDRVEAKKWSGLAKPLPPNIHLMTLNANYYQILDGRILVRFQHMYAKDEHPQFSVPVTIYLKDVFSSLGIMLDSEETILTGVKGINEKLSRKWNIRKQENVEKFESIPYDPKTTKLTLQPMETRTLLIRFVVGARQDL